MRKNVLYTNPITLNQCDVPKISLQISMRKYVIECMRETFLH